MNPKKITDSTLAIVFLSTDELGETTGHSSVEKPLIVLEEEEFEMIKQTDDEQKKSLEADYYVIFNIKPLPEDADLSQYNDLGFKAPGYE